MFLKGIKNYYKTTGKIIPVQALLGQIAVYLSSMPPGT